MDICAQVLMPQLQSCNRRHLLICVLLVLLDVGDGLRTQPVGDLIGPQGHTKDVLVVAVLILDTAAGAHRVRGDEEE